jgi:hypothetical protein
MRFRDVGFGDQGRLWHIVAVCIAAATVWTVAALVINAIL